MLASLSKLVGGGFTFPYKFDQDQGEASWGRWMHYRGTANDDGAAVSVFKMTCPLSETEVIEAAKNGVKRLRTVRHPNILAFKDTAEQEDRQSITIYLVTEPVSMLPNVLGELQLQGEERAEYFSVGLRQAATAVAFLNNDCKLIHGNVCRSSVVVTDTLDWKLAFLDLLTEHAAAGTGQLASAALLVAPQYLPGEVGKQSWAAVASGPPWAVDAWGLGCLMQEVWTGEPLLGMEALRNTACVPEAIRSEYQRLLASTPSKRINTAKVASCDGLRNSMVELVEFMDNLAVKDSLEKEKFFKRLPSRIEHIPDKVATQKLLPMVADALQFGGAPAVALAPLLELGKKLDEEQFTARVVPTISRLFTSNDRSIRRSLLEALPQYSSALTPKVVEEQIYTPLSAGFSEQHAYLRELTLKCMLQLAPKLSQRTLNQSLLKHLARLQVDEEPSIRANTTILLGNIAQYLGETACKRILLNAFTRALKDQFPPSRVAALRALVATQQYYGMDEIATRLLPAASPLAIEPLQDVRTAALACIDASLASLKQHSRRLDAAGDAGGGAGAGASASSLGAGAGGDKGGTIAGQASSMLNWAVSSIMSAPAAGTASAAPAAARPRTTGPPTSAPAAARQPSQSPTHAPARHGGADADGWGDDDDEEFEAMDEEELAARQRLSRAAGPKPGAPANPANRGLKQMQDAVEDAGTGWDGDDTDGWGNLDDLRPAAADTQLDMPSSRRRTAGDEASARKLPSASVKARKPMKLGATRIAKDA